MNAPNKEVQYGGQRAPNRWGVYDVHGNLSEWCYDVYREDAYTRCCCHCLRRPRPKAVARVVRGGSVKSKADECRVAARAQAAPEAKSPTLGFRIVRDKLPTSPKYYRSRRGKKLAANRSDRHCKGLPRISRGRRMPFHKRCGPRYRQSTASPASRK
ncbi:MAG: formylglycine-generating enzyme family protein [Candidatus Hydrogenedentales bacterium]